MGEKNRSTGILSWSVDDRPREKLLQKGRDALSDAELLAILISTGTKERTAVDIAKELLQSVGNDLNLLGELTLNQLSKPRGMGPAKAVTIAAALELGRRRKAAEKPKQDKIGSSKDAYEYLYPYLADLPNEVFYVLLMRRNNSIKQAVRISEGGVAGTMVDPKMVFRKAIEEACSSIIICHNHPSGNLQPSQSDIELTKKLIRGGRELDISVLDHLIFTNDGYYSFADEGMMSA